MLWRFRRQSFVSFASSFCFQDLVHPSALSHADRGLMDRVEQTGAPIQSLHQPWFLNLLSSAVAFCSSHLFQPIQQVWHCASQYHPHPLCSKKRKKNTLEGAWLCVMNIKEKGYLVFVFAAIRYHCAFNLKWKRTSFTFEGRSQAIWLYVKPPYSQLNKISTCSAHLPHKMIYWDGWFPERQQETTHLNCSLAPTSGCKNIIYLYMYKRPFATLGFSSTRSSSVCHWGRPSCILTERACQKATINCASAQQMTEDRARKTQNLLRSGFIHRPKIKHVVTAKATDGWREMRPHFENIAQALVDLLADYSHTREHEVSGDES